MATNITFNGVQYSVPAYNDIGYAQGAGNLSAYFIAIANGSLQQTGGNFTLTSDVNFGPTFGLLAAYYKSRSANTAAAGNIRLARTDTINWRNNANLADLPLAVSATDRLTFNGVELGTDVLTNGHIYIGNASNVAADVPMTGDVAITNTGATSVNNVQNGVITNVMVNNAAAIAYSKLNLALSIVNGDISASAAIAYSKLNLALSIVNGDISASAAIAYAKLAALTASRALQSDGSGVVSVSSVTSTELGYVSGVTGGIQGQFTGKANTTLNNLGSVAFNADLIPDGSNTRAVGSTSAPVSSVIAKTGFVHQQTAAGTNAVTIEGPNGSPSGSYRIALPDAAPSVAGYTMKVKTLGTPNILEWGAASGSGSINYILNPDAEAGTTGWATFADAAQSTPTDGTGGSPTVTWTRSTSSPLIGTANFLFTKDAANRQGQGASYDFTIDSAYKNSVLQIQFNYLPSAAYVNQELTVYLYDITNAQIIQPGGYLINQVLSPSRWIGTFQTTASTSYRLIFFIAGTTATAYTMQIDGVSVGPQIVQYGAPVSDFTAYTPTWFSISTSQSGGFWRRVGDSMEVEVSCTLSSAPSGTISVNIPTGYAIDTAKLKWPNVLEPVGWVKASRANAPIVAMGNPVIKAVGSGPITEVQFYGGQTSGTAWDSAYPGGVWVSGDIIVARIFVPIVGWSSSVSMSNDTDTRVVAFEARNSASLTVNGGVSHYLNYPLIDSDTHAAYTPGVSWTSGTGPWSTDPSYKIPVAGFYLVNAFTLINPNTNWAVNQAANMYIEKNGTAFATVNSYAWSANATPVPLRASAVIQCNAGDLIKIRALVNIATSWGTDTGNISIQRLSGPASIAATETVACRGYRATSVQSIANNASTNINFNARSFDSHNALDLATGVYTAPISGVYMVSAHQYWVQASFADTGYESIELWKNGTRYALLNTLDQVGPTETKAFSQNGTSTVRLLAGDGVSIVSYQANNGGSRDISFGEDKTYICVNRVGNY